MDEGIKMLLIISRGVCSCTATRGRFTAMESKMSVDTVGVQQGVFFCFVFFHKIEPLEHPKFSFETYGI